MQAKTARFSWGGMMLLVCGMLTLTGFFVTPAQQASASTTAFVRIIHASPFIGSADIFVDGSPLLTAFGFGKITGYVPVPAGKHTVQIAFTGKGINASVLVETLPSIQPGVAYTVAALGTDANHLSLGVFVDDNRATPGTAKVCVYQLAPDGGSMSVTSAGKTVVAGVGYQKSSNYVSLSADAHAFDLKSSVGSLSWADTLKANTVTSLFVVGVFNTSKYNGEPQADVVSATAEAVPGLPQTGSNPFTFISDGQLSTPWLLIALATLCIAGTFFTRRLFSSH